MNSYFKLFVFGAHLSEKHGNSVDLILAEGFEIGKEIETNPVDDSPKAIVESMAQVMRSFAEVWSEEASSTDLVICLGDRYEMFAAVSPAQGHPYFGLVSLDPTPYGFEKGAVGQGGDQPVSARLSRSIV